MKAFVGKHDIVFMTLDTLRYDVAQHLHETNKTPNLSQCLPKGGWEKRHSPGSFTYAAHQAFFAGFLPTPARPGKHPRLFAASFAGSETTANDTFVFEGEHIVQGLQEVDYHTICIGGVGFFNKQTAIGRVFPNMFDESHWHRTMGVTDPDSTKNQFELAAQLLDKQDDDQRIFLFINVAALHQPNYFYLQPDKQTQEKRDSIESHAAALMYIDAQLPILLNALKRRGTSFCIFCGDHGTAYGEEGFYGHRLAHEVVMNVPYAHFLLR